MTRARALLALHAAVLLFGSAGLFGRWLDLSPPAIVLGRTAVAAAMLAAVRLPSARRSPLDATIAVNGAILALHWVTFFAAIQAAGVAIGLLGYASFPLFTLVLERWLLGRRWRAADAVTSVTVALGLALLVPAPSFADRAVQGLAWGIASGLAFALLVVRNRRLVPDRSATDLAFGQNLWAAAALLPWVVWSGVPSTIGGRELVLLLVLGVACTALAHTLFIAALAAVAAHTAATVAALEPVYGIALAVLLLDETPSIRTLVGGALIVGAAIVASRRTDATA